MSEFEHDTYSNSRELLEAIASSGKPYSQALDRLLLLLKERQLALPCQPLAGLQDVDIFLGDKCPLRFYTEPFYGGTPTYYITEPEGTRLPLNFNHMYTSDRALFIVSHAHRAGQPDWTSLAEHNFTSYDDLYGPHLWDFIPALLRKQKSVSFRLVTQYDPPGTLDRLPHVHAVGTSSAAAAAIIHGSFTFGPHDAPRPPSYYPLDMVFIPLNRQELWQPCWQVYGLDCTNLSPLHSASA